MLVTADKENQRVQCIGDTTGKELPWFAARQAREQELKHLRDLGVNEKVDECVAIARFRVHSSRQGVDRHKRKHSMERPVQMRSRLVARDFKTW